MHAAGAEPTYLLLLCGADGRQRGGEGGMPAEGAGRGERKRKENEAWGPRRAAGRRCRASRPPPHLGWAACSCSACRCSWCRPCPAGSAAPADGSAGCARGPPRRRAPPRPPIPPRAPPRPARSPARRQRPAARHRRARTRSGAGAQVPRGRRCATDRYKRQNPRE